MRRVLTGIVALLALAPGLWAAGPPGAQAKEQEKEAAKKEQALSTPAEQYRALVQEFNGARVEFSKAYQKAKTEDERNTLIREKLPKPADYAGKMLDLAEKNPKDPVAVDALVWVVQQLRVGDSANKALGMLLSHAEDKKVQSVCSALVFSSSPQAEKLLRAVMEKNPDASAQASAAFSLVQHLLNRTDRGNAPGSDKLEKEAEQIFDQAIAKHGDSEQLGAMAQQLGNSRSAAAGKLLRLIAEKSKKRDVQGIACLGLAESLKRQSEQATDKAQGEAAAKEAEAMFERVAKDFGDVKRFNSTLGEAAKGGLNEIRLLGVGKTAPDIEADDLDGKAFKLSDYRGKVVLLDFWGHW